MKLQKAKKVIPFYRQNVGKNKRTHSKRARRKKKRSINDMTGTMPLKLPNLIKKLPEGLDPVETSRNLVENKKCANQIETSTPLAPRAFDFFLCSGSWEFDR